MKNRTHQQRQQQQQQQHHSSGGRCVKQRCHSSVEMTTKAATTSDGSSSVVVRQSALRQSVRCRNTEARQPARSRRRHRRSSAQLTSRSPAPLEQEHTEGQCRARSSSTLTAKHRRRYRSVNGSRLKWCLPGFGSSSALTIALVIALQLVALQPTVLHGAKTFYMHWNTTNSIFRIDNTDHIIDVNKGNSQFEYDQVHIICPVYEPGTFDNETEKYIIYNVSKVEYETCRITNHDPRIIAICDKPNKLMFFTITFRPFTPQPGGLEFLPGNDYYFISTSSKDDLHRRIGGRCTTDNMKVVFKVCCSDDQNQQQQLHHGHLPSNGTVIGGGGAGGSGGVGGPHDAAGNNTISIDAFDPNSRLLPPAINTSQGNIVQNTVNWPVWNDGQQQHQQPPAHLPPHVRPPPVATPPIGANGRHNHHYTASPPRTSINGGTGGSGNVNNHNYNINSPPSSSGHPGSGPGGSNQKPTKKTKEYDKQHPNEVVKNEELTYNNGAAAARWRRPASLPLTLAVALAGLLLGALAHPHGVHAATGWS